MVQIIYLAPDEAIPSHRDDEPWLVVEATEDGLFFGTGASWKPTGEWGGYISLAQNDHSLEAALAAAEQWAAEYAVPIICVQTTP